MKRGGGLMKLLLVVGGVVVLLGVLAFAGVTYGLYRAKKAVTGMIEGENRAPVSDTAAFRGRACDLLTGPDVQGLLGVTIERTAAITENGENGCAYYTTAEAFAELQQKALAEAQVEAERAKKEDEASPPSNSDNPLELLKHTKELEGVVKTFALSKASDDGRVFSFTVNPRFGRSNWTALRLSMAVVPGFDELRGIGDRAMVGSFGHALYVLKGDNMVSLNLMYVPESRVKGSGLGSRIVAGM
ncbi:MAG: hypothetical protein ABI972_06320 [Acidobacteriota bacterium]